MADTRCPRWVFRNFYIVERKRSAALEAISQSHGKSGCFSFSAHTPHKMHFCVFLNFCCLTSVMTSMFVFMFLCACFVIYESLGLLVCLCMCLYVSVCFSVSVCVSVSVFSIFAASHPVYCTFDNRQTG